MRRLGLALALLLAGCLPPADEPSLAHDLRILAIRADPPEVRADAEASARPKIRLEALVVDPGGAGRTLEYTFLACPFSALVCDGEAAVTMGPYALEGEVASAEFEPSEAFGRALFDGNPLAALIDAQATVTLRVRAPGGEEVLGVKRLIFVVSPPAGQPANLNPPEPELLLGEQPWPADRVPLLARRPVHLDVQAVDAALKPTYQVLGYDGQHLAFRESWKYRWYTTKGFFEAEETGGLDAEGVELLTGSRLVLPDPASGGPLSVYVVVRDGRGGESWARRDAVFAP